MNTWRDVMLLVEGFVKQAGSTVSRIRKALKDLPLAMPGYGDVYYHPEKKIAWIVLGDSDDGAMWKTYKNALKDIPGVEKVDGASESAPPGARSGIDSGKEPWIRIKRANHLTELVQQLSGWKEDPANEWYGGPSPLAATLAGGLLGAGGGYALGTLGEQFLPKEHFERGKLRRTLALLGGGAGAAPGALWGLTAHQKHPETPGWPAWRSAWPFRQGDSQSLENSTDLLRQVAPIQNQYFNTQPNGPPWLSSLKTACAAAREQLDGYLDSHYKQALYDEYGGQDLSFTPMIPAPQFNQAVWSDPMTPEPIQAATTGLVDSACAASRSRLVSPADIGRIAMGMGSGYLSGMFVGKTLGALAGLKPESQKKLQEIGMWAGILNTTVPLAFGR